MRYESLKGPLRSLLFLAFAVCITALTISRVSHSSSAGRTSGVSTHGTAVLSPGERAQARQLLLDGVGTSVSLVREGALAGQVRASVDTVRSFIRERSGLELTSETSDRLVEMEQQAQSGSVARISCDELSDTVLAILVERFRHSTDAEIEQAAAQLANVKTMGPEAQGAGGSNGKTGPGDQVRLHRLSLSPTRGGDRVMLRADGRWLMDQAELMELAKQYRARMNAPAQMIAIIGIVRPLVRQAFQKRLAVLSQGLPEQWGDAQGRGLSPVQAFLLSYSVVADDPLYRSSQGLQQAMKWVEDVNVKADSNHSYPSAAGRLPYGSSGYLFSTPLELILDGQTCSSLLDRIAERTSK